MVGPKAQQFAQPWASPRGTRHRDFLIGPTGQPFSWANRWPVGPINTQFIVVPTPRALPTLLHTSLDVVEIYGDKKNTLVYGRFRRRRY